MITSIGFLLVLLIILLIFQPINCFFNSKLCLYSSKYSKTETSSISASNIGEILRADYESIIPFLSEHVQPSDQILFVGASTDLAIQLNENGYGSQKTGVMTVIDSNNDQINALESVAKNNNECNINLEKNKLKFIQTDLSNMPTVCQQSTYDAIIDYGGLDELILKGDKNNVLKCIDHLQDAVRLGNILVCLSKLEKAQFCAPFDERFGWVNELDGDPGELSAWYRGKSNISATKSNFGALGLKMYVYTNTDNC